MLIKMKLNSKQNRQFKLITEKLFQTFHSSFNSSVVLLNKIAQYTIHLFPFAHTSVKLGCKIVSNSFNLYGEKLLYLKLKSTLYGFIEVSCKQKMKPTFHMRSQTGRFKIKRVRLLSEWNGKLNDWNERLLEDMYYTD